MMSARGSFSRLTSSNGGAPPASVEYAFYGVVAYGILAVALGVSVPSLAGAAMAFLAVMCVFRAGPGASRIYRPIAAAIGAAALLMLIQLAVHRESLQDLRPFVVWVFTLIVVQSLALRRGFLRRFVGLAVLIGVGVLPYMNYRAGGRAGLDATMGLGLSNPNDLAAWFGFCATWLTIAGIESKRHGTRILWWAAGLVCLYVVSLTVSRGTLLAFVVAVTVASRRLLSRGFVPALCLVMVAGVTYEAGVFQSTAEMYQARGMEETGRLIVWPLAAKRFLESPLTGVGLSHVATFDATAGHEISPHNTFLFVGLASGIGPLGLFIAYWIRATKTAIRTTHAAADEPFRVPLLLYALVQSMIGNVTFMAPWFIVGVSVAAAQGIPCMMLESSRGQAIRFHGRPQSRRHHNRLPVGSGTFRRHVRRERWS